MRFTAVTPFSPVFRIAKNTKQRNSPSWKPVIITGPQRPSPVASIRSHPPAQSQDQHAAGQTKTNRPEARIPSEPGSVSAARINQSSAAQHIAPSQVGRSRVRACHNSQRQQVFESKSCFRCFCRHQLNTRTIQQHQTVFSPLLAHNKRYAAKRRFSNPPSVPTRGAAITNSRTGHAFSPFLSTATSSPSTCAAMMPATSSVPPNQNSDRRQIACHKRNKPLRLLKFFSLDDDELSKNDIHDAEDPVVVKN